MADNFSTFPSNKFQALTMLYLENQDLSGLTPAQIVLMYNEVYTEVSNEFSNIRKKTPSLDPAKIREMLVL